MQVAIKPEIKETLVKLTDPKGRISWFAGLAEIGRNTVTRLRKDAEQFAEEDVVNKIEAALKLPEVRQLIKQDRKATA